MSRKKRPLSRKDLHLWKKVTETVEPLKERATELKALIEAIEQPLPLQGAQATNQTGDNSPSKAQIASKDDLKALKEAGISSPRSLGKQTIPPLNMLDRREKKRVRQGRLGIEARLDLHGMTQSQAHSALFGFLRASQAQGFKHVLVITGKGSRGGSDPYADGPSQGILRRVVPKWLSEPDIRSIIVGFEEAHRSLGGAGALHIRLRARNKHGQKP
ncbi:MAG: Smr/MutS family protein [Cohaesibacter sp.]|nr:Smr/MutS family protein [Cohaesibacter sp.]